MAPPKAPAASRPNVVLVVLQGLNIAAAGGRSPLPSLERIAARGRRFDNAFAGTAARGAARYALLTGLRPERTGVFGDAERPSAGAVHLEQQLRAAGYFTARVGSVYGGPLEANLTWDAAADRPPGAVAHQAIEVLQAPRDKPLFLAVGLAAEPAAPLPTVPASASPPADPESPLLPSIALGSIGRFARPGGLTRPPPLTAVERRTRAAAAAAAAAAIDGQLGALVDAFDRSARWSDTVFVVVGDTGADRGARGAIAGSDQLYDDLLRVSLVIAAPGVRRPGTPAAALAESVDVYPTLLALCGLPAAELDGLSLVPVLEDPTAPARREVVSIAYREAGEVGRSARSARYRYTEWPDGSEELYDHENDPRELTNLAAQTARAGDLVAMRSYLADRFPASPPPPPPAPPADTPKLNVLMIVLDDMGAQIGALGYPVQTPNIDRLAARGRLFSRAYAQAPSCSPSRSSLLSGWRPERTDIWNNLTPVRQHLEGATPLQEHFQANGYYTARVGKVYEPMFASEFAWDFNDQVVPGDEPASRREDDPPAGGWWQPTERADEEEPDGSRALLAARLMEANQDKPFFLAVGFAKPHLRWVAPRRYFDLYPPESILLPAEPADDGADIPAIAVKNRAQERPGVMLQGREPRGFILDPAFRRQATAAYYACVSFVDAQVGVLLQTLRRLKIKDRTIVVLLGDHGYHLGEHGGMWRKDTLFEEVLRSALVVAAPQVRDPGRPSAAPVEFLDVYPTLVDLAGLPPVAGLDGASLRPLLEDPAAPWRKAALSFRKAKAPNLGVSIRTARYRYTQWPDGSEELYDHAGDPDELKNLGRDAAARPVLASMRQLRAEGGRSLTGPSLGRALVPPPE